MATEMGELNKRIEIVRIFSGKDKDGYAEEKQEQICKCWAKAEDGSFRANEYFSAQAGKAIETVQFTVRYGIVTKYAVRQGMYVIYEGECHKILSLYNAKHARDYVCLNTRIEKGMSG